LSVEISRAFKSAERRYGCIVYELMRALRSESESERKYVFSLTYQN